MNGEPQPVSPPRRSAAPSALLWAFAIGGTGFGLVGFAVAAVVLLRPPAVCEPLPEAAEPLPSAAVAPPSPSAPPVRLPAPVQGWQSALFADSCAAPCRGGSACPVSGDNAGSRYCSAASTFCTKCTSKITCIPGPAKARLAPGEKWMLHLSMIYEKRRGRRVSNPCKSDADLWLCLKPNSAKTWDCAALSDACQNSGGAAKGIPITSEDLISDGVEVEIRSGGATGRVVARRTHATYSSLGRAALCNGFKMALPGSKQAEAFTFFLMPPG